MAQAAREAMGKKRLRALANRGYYSGPQIKACTDAGIAVVLPKPTTAVRVRLTRACRRSQARPHRLVWAPARALVRARVDVTRFHRHMSASGTFKLTAITGGKR